MTYVFTIAGVTKTVQVGWSIDEVANGLNRLMAEVYSADGSYRPAVDNDIIITENGTRIYGGLIELPSEGPAAGAISRPSLWHRIAAVSYKIYASRAVLTAEIPAGTFKAALVVVVAALADYGVTLDAAQVDGPALPALSYNNRRVVDVLDEVCAIASGTDATSYVWEIDYSKELRGFKSDSLSAPFNIADGDRNVIGGLRVEHPRSADYGNYILLYGGTGLKDESDTFTGDGVTTNFTLNYTLNSSLGYVTVNGVYETLGAGATWTYDAATNSITRTSAPAAAASIVIDYVAAFPRVVIADGGLPAASRVTKVYTAPEVFDSAVLQAMANSLLTRDMASPKQVTYAAAYSKTGLHPGQQQTIASTKHNLSGAHLLTAVRIVSIGHRLTQRQVTAVTSLRLPATTREKVQQAFGGSSSGASATAGVTVVTGGTYLSSPASLGGSDITWRACDTPARVPNAQPYDAPATLAVTIQGLYSARAAQNVTIHLWDETDGASEFNSGALAATATPAAFSFSGTVTTGHRYWLYIAAGTAGISATAVGQVTT